MLYYLIVIVCVIMGDHKILLIPTLHWRPDDRLTEGVPRFRALRLLAHLVYPWVGRVALFLMDLS